MVKFFCWVKCTVTEFAVPNIARLLSNKVLSVPIVPSRILLQVLSLA